MTYDWVTYTMEAAVARGAALLDERKPGWWSKIDLVKLSMGNCSECALGQLFKRFERGGVMLCDGLKRPLSEDKSDKRFWHGNRYTDWAVWHGFDKLDRLERLDSQYGYDSLKLYWTDAINSRRAQQSLPERTPPEQTTYTTNQSGACPGYSGGKYPKGW